MYIASQSRYIVKVGTDIKSVLSNPDCGNIEVPETLSWMTYYCPNAGLEGNVVTVQSVHPQYSMSSTSIYEIQILGEFFEKNLVFVVIFYYYL